MALTVARYALVPKQPSVPFSVQNTAQATFSFLAQFWWFCRAAGQRRCHLHDGSLHFASRESAVGQ
jgi:hypothetical protein